MNDVSNIKFETSTDLFFRDTCSTESPFSSSEMKRAE